MAERVGDKSARRLRLLLRLLQSRRRLLVVMQDNPDPDAIAAAAALRELARTVQVACSLAHGGSVGRGENRALVKYLGVNLRPLSSLRLRRFDAIALVDTQPGTGNNSLPAEIVPDIVIDHHPIRAATRRAHFFDIRSRYGATSTILWEYLRHAGITPAAPLATALLYGIRSDTQDLGRAASQADVVATGQLYEMSNRRMLGYIQMGEVPPGYFQSLSDALHNARLHQRCIISPLGRVDNADMMAEVADLLLRHPQVDWTLCLGAVDGRLFFSVRTDTPAGRADLVAQQVAGRRGAGGGHSASGGGRIPLASDSEDCCRRETRAAIGRFFDALGLKRRGGTRLVQLDGSGKKSQKTRRKQS
jgi:nanoRNase/pAp phosphatase (c-di-AMP/oligoRNAs hydrolase)